MGRTQAQKPAHLSLRNVLRHPGRMIACALAGVAVATTCAVAAPVAMADQTVGPKSAQGYWSFDKTAEDGTYVNEGTKNDLKLTVSGEGAKVEQSDLASLGNALSLPDKNKDFDVKVEKAVDSQKKYSISLWVQSIPVGPVDR